VEFSTLLWWVLPTSVRQDCPHKMAAQAHTGHNMRLIVSGSNASCLQSKLYKYVFNSASLAFWIRLCNRLAPTSDVKRNDIFLAWHAVEHVHMLDTRYVTISGYRGNYVSDSRTIIMNSLQYCLGWVQRTVAPLHSSSMVFDRQAAYIPTRHPPLTKHPTCLIP